jgi:hypothetical protein
MRFFAAEIRTGLSVKGVISDLIHFVSILAFQALFGASVFDGRILPVSS